MHLPFYSEEYDVITVRHWNILQLRGGSASIEALGLSVNRGLYYVYHQDKGGGVVAHHIYTERSRFYFGSVPFHRRILRQTFDKYCKGNALLQIHLFT